MLVGDLFELGRLRGLVELKLSRCNLASDGLPRCALGPLAGSLERLDLAGNALTRLPRALGRLGKLTALDVSYNRLQALDGATLSALGRGGDVDGSGGGGDPALRSLAASGNFLEARSSNDVDRKEALREPLRV